MRWAYLVATPLGSSLLSGKDDFDDIQSCDLLDLAVRQSVPHSVVRSRVVVVTETTNAKFHERTLVRALQETLQLKQSDEGPTTHEGEDVHLDVFEADVPQLGHLSSQCSPIQTFHF